VEVMCRRSLTQHVSDVQTTKIEADVRSQLPSSFHRTRWIHGNMDRIGAEDLLQEHGQVSDSGNYWRDSRC
jgi:hypothetical protein